MTKISQLPSIGDSLAIGDQFLIRDIDDAGNPNKSVTVSGITRALDLGIAAAPAIAFASDKNTGIYSPGTDQLAASTAGSERLRITSTGFVGIGTSAPGCKLQISETFATAGTKDVLRLQSESAIDGAVMRIGGYAYTGNARAAIDFLQNGGTGFQSQLIFSTSAGADAIERARIDSSGRLLVGTSNAIAEQFSGQARTQIAGTNYYNLASFQYSNDAFENVTSFCKSRGASIGTHAVVQSNDTLSSLRVQGSDGTGFVIAAAITVQADGSAVTTAGSFVAGRRYKILTVGDTNFTLIGASANTVGVIFAATGAGTGTGTATSEPYTNSMPGRLVFSTTADGTSSPTERLRITSAGVFQITDGSHIQVGTTTGTKIGTATTQKLGFYNATPVVQPAAVANATTAVDVITQLNDLLAKLRTLGIIAT